MQLDGIRVLDLTHRLPGPYATQLLADLGADVIKVEPPGGESGRPADRSNPSSEELLFDAVNRGKRSVALNLKTDEGVEAFYQLVANADVLLEGFRPGVVDRLGIAPDDVRPHNDDLVYCSLSGYGQTGPYRERVGHDLNYVATAGILDMSRSSTNERPRIPGVPIADVAGGLFAAFSIVSGLLGRADGSGGTYLDVSMTDASLSLAQVVMSTVLAGEQPRPGETLLTGGVPWYGVYETADGRYLTIAAFEPTFWETFCHLVDRDGWIDLHGTDDAAERAALREALSDLFAERPLAEWTDLLADEETTVAPVRTPAETAGDPHFRERGLFVGSENESGDATRVGMPVLVDGEIPEATGTTPELGEHTESMLRECGYDDGDLERLRDANAV